MSFVCIIHERFLVKPQVAQPFENQALRKEMATLSQVDATPLVVKQRQDLEKKLKEEMKQKESRSLSIAIRTQSVLIESVVLEMIRTIAKPLVQRKEGMRTQHHTITNMFYAEIIANFVRQIAMDERKQEFQRLRDRRRLAAVSLFQEFCSAIFVEVCSEMVVRKLKERFIKRHVLRVIQETYTRSLRENVEKSERLERFDQLQASLLGSPASSVEKKVEPTYLEHIPNLGTSTLTPPIEPEATVPDQQNISKFDLLQLMKVSQPSILRLAVSCQGDQVKADEFFKIVFSKKVPLPKSPFTLSVLNDTSEVKLIYETVFSHS